MLLSTLWTFNVVYVWFSHQSAYIRKQQEKWEINRFHWISSLGSLKSNIHAGAGAGILINLFCVPCNSFNAHLRLPLEDRKYCIQCKIIVFRESFSGGDYFVVAIILLMNLDDLFSQATYCMMQSQKLIVRSHKFVQKKYKDHKVQLSEKSYVVVYIFSRLVLFLNNFLKHVLDRASISKFSIHSVLKYLNI